MMIGTTAEDGIDNLHTYGVDWEGQRSVRLMDHFRQNNPGEANDTNPFSTFTQPAHMAEVVCEAPGCPLSEHQVLELDRRLGDACEDLGTKDMQIRKDIWRKALEICQSLFA